MVKLPGLPGGKKLKKFYAEMAMQNYCCYLAGRFDEGIKRPELSFKDFCKEVKEIHEKGKVLVQQGLKNGDTKRTT